MPKYIVTGEIRYSFSYEVEAEDESDAENQVTGDVSIGDLLDSGDLNEIDVTDVELVDDDE